MKIILPLLIIAGFTVTSFISNMSGKWAGKVKLNGKKDSSLLVYNFKVTGDSLYGTAQGPNGNLPILGGKVKNTSFTFYLLKKGTKEHITHSGTYYGDSIFLKFDQIYQVTLRRVP